MKHLLKNSVIILITILCLFSTTACSKPVVEEEPQSGNITNELSPNPESVRLSVDDYLYDGEIKVAVNPINIQRNEAEGWKAGWVEGCFVFFEELIPLAEWSTVRKNQSMYFTLPNFVSL